MTLTDEHDRRMRQVETTCTQLVERVDAMRRENAVSQRTIEELEGKVDGLRRILMGLIVTIATGCLMLLITLALTGRAGS